MTATLTENLLGPRGDVYYRGERFAVWREYETTRGERRVALARDGAVLLPGVPLRLVVIDGRDHDYEEQR